MNLVGRQFVCQHQPSTKERSMISTKLASISLAAALFSVLPAVQAKAQAIRTFVSVAGSDSNPCSITQPCRHFQAAVTATAVGGEVDALDAGAYGSFTISQAITIEGQGWSYVAPPNNGNAITITAGSGDVTIRGVSLNGVGATGGTNGIVFNSGGSLTVTDCVLQNFGSTGVESSGNGIWMRPSVGTVSFVITNTIASNNGYAGISYLPLSGTATANGVIDHVVVTNSGAYGIAVYTGSGGGSTAVAISNGIVSQSNSPGPGTGINISNGTAALAVSIDNTTVSGNLIGIAAAVTSNVTLGRSVITANSTDGILNSTGPNTFYSYSDNRINGNGTDISGALNYTRSVR
jgi:hypothetical protein